MSEPCFAVTGDDARFYNSPYSPEKNKKSVTTIKKQGVPNPIMSLWEKKNVAICALDQFDILLGLREQELKHIPKVAHVAKA